MTEIEPGQQNTSNKTDIVNPHDFTIELQKYYSEHCENSKKFEWTNQRIQSIIKFLDEYKIIKSQGRRPTNKHYHHARKYDTMNIGNQKVLIVKIKNISDPVVQIIPTEEYYEKIFDAHIATGHGRRDKIVHVLKDKYVVRAVAMEAAARERAGGMLTVWLAPDARLGALLRAARDAARPDAVCQVANYLHPGCKVLAGDEEALRFVERSGRAWGVRRAARVRVAGAFHTPLMARAEAAVREALRSVRLAAPRVPLVSGVDARVVRSADAARRRLARLTAAPVRWEQVLHVLYARPRDTPQPLTLALGPGATLRSTLKLVNARAWDSSLLIDV